MSTYVERLEELNIETHDDGCSAECYPADVWELETTAGTETVLCDVADIPDTLEIGSHPLDSLYQIDESFGTDFLPQLLQHVFGEYVEGEVHSGERMSRYIANWTMPGYLDQGITHTADSESEALTLLLEYDGSSGTLGEESIPSWEYDAIYRLAELADSGDTEAQAEIVSLLQSARV